ncbi:hypothetical protein DFH06DRAFT_1327530 [Mycena polygramma]|nr:hypothetical protein DFH06DRAFT_1327530 [Mycena polygramma]
MPSGFLFLCPTEDFRTGRSSFCWPKLSAYWSLDPAGVEILTMEGAIELGFPELQCSTQLMGRSWDSSVYAGLRKFHQAKGFNPYSEDIARHLGLPLYRPSDTHVPFAHVNDGGNSAEDLLTSTMDVDEIVLEKYGNDDLPGMDLSW